MISLYEPRVSEKGIKRVERVIRSGQIAQGPEVAKLERRFAEFCGVNHAVAVNNGTAALHAALYALGVGPGDEVIVPAFTFVATANAVLMVGAEPVFADIDPLTFNMDPRSVEEMIGPKTKAVIVVNLYGMPADWDDYHALAEAYKLKLVEDAAQSVGSEYKGLRSGNLADVGCFSFYATKNLMSGEGGMVTTNKMKYQDKLKLFRHHGQDAKRRYSYRDLGYNYRMTDVQAVLVDDGLDRLDKDNTERVKNAGYYSNKIGAYGLVVPKIAKDRTHVYHQYTVRVRRSFGSTRKQLMEYLTEKGVGCGVYYPKPLYKAHHLSKCRRFARHLKHSEEACREVLSLPVRPGLTRKELDGVSDLLMSRA